MLEQPQVLMAGQNAIGFHDEVAYVEYNGLAFDYSEGERLARALGERSVLVLRNHGVLVIGHTVAQAFERLYFFERACRTQVLALSTGGRLHLVPEEVVRATAAQFRSGDKVGGEDRTELHFAALRRQLDRSEPDYAD
jgi:ribulose-5-phosphate 4-epimerase/fuculose-1-phosphate aldolase